MTADGDRRPAVTTPTEPTGLREALDAADKAVDDLCQGRLRWEMRVPAEPDHDPDLIISRALSLARAALSPGPEPVAETWAARHGWPEGSVRDEWNTPGPEPVAREAFQRALYDEGGVDPVPSVMAIYDRVHRSPEPVAGLDVERLTVAIKNVIEAVDRNPAGLWPVDGVKVAREYAALSEASEPGDGS